MGPAHRSTSRGTSWLTGSKESRPSMSTRMRLALVAASILLCLAGCGGSGSRDVPPPPVGEPPPEEPLGDLTVTVDARDAFGGAVPDAEILLLYSSDTGFWQTGVRTDANGQATLDHAPDNTHALILSADGLYGSQYFPPETAGDGMEFDVTLHPSSSLSPGVGSVEITDVSADATRLTFKARLYIVETYA